jgi:hypothetical protein
MRADDRPAEIQLLVNLRAAMPALRALQTELDEDRNQENLVYRFYHQSFKVYPIQALTQRIVDVLQALAPARPLNAWFAQIVREGTGATFTQEHNKRWLEVTRPMIEAYFHARYFLDMALRYGAELEEAPSMMPYGWAAFLYLYDLR